MPMIMLPNSFEVDAEVVEETNASCFMNGAPGKIAESLESDWVQWHLEPRLLQHLLRWAEATSASLGISRQHAIMLAFVGTARKHNLTLGEMLRTFDCRPETARCLFDKAVVPV